MRKICNSLYRITFDEEKITIMLVKEQSEEELLSDIINRVDSEVYDLLKEGLIGFNDLNKNTIIKINIKTNKALLKGKKELKLFSPNGFLHINLIDETYSFKDCLVEYNSKNNEVDDFRLVYDRIKALYNDFSEMLESDFISRVTIFTSINLYDEDRYATIIENDEVMLSLPNFYKEDASWMHLTIVDKKSLEVVGNIEFHLNPKEESNFSYAGNIAYEVKEKYRRKGYASRALALLVEYIKKVEDEYNKTLYAAVVEENIASLGVINKSGGILTYDGEVPKGDKLRIYEKVEKVKVYKLGE